MNLRIREANTADLPQILNLYLHGLEDKAVLTIEQAEQIFNKMSTYPNYKVYVAENEAEMLGTFALLIMENLGHMGTPSAVVEDVAVLPNHQGKGIGKQMMRFALEQATEAGGYKMALSSNLRRHDAHAFYESLGFTKHGYSFKVDTE